MPHDPRKIIEILREHLATHDRRLSFLFGAGTSSSVNIAPPPKPGKPLEHAPLVPAMAGLTALCRAAVCELGEDREAAWDLIVKECAAGGRPGNVEGVLSRIRLKLVSAGAGDMPLGLPVESLADMEQVIRRTIAGAAAVPEALIPGVTPHDQFALWTKRVTRNHAIEVFTTNYDLLVERALEAARVAVFDGFVGVYRPFFTAECFENEERLPGAFSVRLWKIHGSVNWHEVVIAGSRRIVREGISKEGELIFPSDRKYDESRKQPYLAMLDRLGSVLSSGDSLLVTVGYSFGDQHVNATIYDVLDNRPLTHVIALCHGDLSPDDSLVKDAFQRPNLMVLARNGAVVRGEWAEWQLREPVSDATSGFVDLMFDSNAAPDDQIPNLALTGRFVGGDFNRFCAFLVSMQAD